LGRALAAAPRGPVGDNGADKDRGEVLPDLVPREEINANGALLAECRQLEHALGLSVISMKRLGWSVGEPPSATVTPIEEARPQRRLILAEDGEE
jgi:hypothetical protein